MHLIHGHGNDCLQTVKGYDGASPHTIRSRYHPRVAGTRGRTGTTRNNARMRVYCEFVRIIYSTYVAANAADRHAPKYGSRQITVDNGYLVLANKPTND